MSTTYSILVVDPRARLGDEPMGTKEKFWYASGDTKWLFKKARLGTGEDWAEKVATEIGRCLGLPTAEIDLAVCEGIPGTASRSFLQSDDVLVHGNELLREGDSTYPAAQLRGVSKHTVAAVLKALSSVAPPREMRETDLLSAADWFVGYLLLDALVANGDRHHENWGVLQSVGWPVCLAPSYDHASSLGRELRDSERTERLTSRDRRRTVQAYAARARSAFYAGEGDARPLHPVDAFVEAARRLPGAATFWCARLRDVPVDDLTAVLGRVPASRLSVPAGDFARALLLENRRRLEKAVTAHE